MVPYLDLEAQYYALKEEIGSAINGVIESGCFVLGPAVNRFEELFAEYCHVKHAVGVNSGTSGLHLALLALDIGEGDEVIAPAMTFVATISAIEYTGARPILVDIDPVTYTMDPDKIEESISPRTKAIIPVHLYGHAAAMDPIMKIAKKHGLAVVEDAAQAHAAEYKGRRVGSIGDLGCFSFYPGKNLGAYGEAGVVTTNRGDLAERIRQLRDWGQADKGLHILRGYNYRMDGIQGAVLSVKLKHLDSWTDRRRIISERYSKSLNSIP